MNRVIVSLMDEEQEFQRLQAESARRAAAGRIAVEVVFAEGNAVLQIQQLYRQIHAPQEERPCALIVEPVSRDGMQRVATAAVSAGVGWVLLRDGEPYLEELARLAPTLAVAAVSTDDEEIGRIQGRQIVALLPKGGSLLLLEGPGSQGAAAARRRGLESVIAGRAIRVEKSLTGDWTEASGERAMRSWFRLKTSEASRVDLIAAQNDGMAIGARRVIASDRPAWLSAPLLGCDGLPAGGLREVREGRLTATVMQQPAAGAAVEIVLRAASGERVPRHTVLSPQTFPSLEKLEELGRKP